MTTTAGNWRVPAPEPICHELRLGQFVRACDSETCRERYGTIVAIERNEVKILSTHGIPFWAHVRIDGVYPA